MKELSFLKGLMLIKQVTQKVLYLSLLVFLKLQLTAYSFKFQPNKVCEPKRYFYFKHYKF